MVHRQPWAAHFVVRDSASLGELEVRPRIADGSLIRVIRGVYLPAAIAASAGPRAAHRRLAYAHELRRPGAHIFSHSTAAAIWRLPRLGAWPTSAHVTIGASSGGRSTGALVRHPRDGVDPDSADGLTVTSLGQTVVDIASADGFTAGLLAADAAIGSLSLPLSTIVGLLPPFGARGRARAGAVVEFADGRSGSPGESLSRARMIERQLPSPELQFRIDDREGTMFVDFCWPELGVVGEFDGVSKYVREEFAGRRTPAEVVVDEKWREDRIRLLGWRVVRWGWQEARDPRLLLARLADAGVTPRPRARHL